MAAKRESREKSRTSRLGSLNPVFHKRAEEEDNSALPDSVISAAQKTGILKFTGKGLVTVPDKVYNANEISKNNRDIQGLTVREEDAWWNQLAITSLDLSSNSLLTISPKIKNLDTLTTLNLYDNGISELPCEIACLDKLTYVNLSRNRLKNLPDKFYTLPDLHYLNLSYNVIETLPKSISDLHMLEHLDISHNSLKSLPNGIGYLVRVTDLLLSHNHITRLPPDLVNMRSLRNLDLNHNDLSKLPEDIGTLRKLVCLYLQHNNIEELPTFEGSQCLQELYLGNNYIKSIPSIFYSNVPHLKILDLRDNKISEVPNDVCLLINLTRLDLTNNNLENLPYSLGSLAHLLSLQIEGNPIKSIRRDILQCGTTRILKTLRERAITKIKANGFLEGQGIPDQYFAMGADGLNNSPRSTAGGGDDSPFPDKYTMRQTHCLNITMLNLTDVPDEVFENAANEHVSCIDLSKNSLHEIPKGLKLMSSKAKELVCANNKLREVPTYLSQFEHLNLLNLSCNQLTDLPRELGVLNTLRELNICNNRFQSIPSCVYKMPNLQVFLAGDNAISQIDASPEGLGALKRLAILDVRNNDINHIPPILGNLKNITTLELVGNPFRQPRHQIISKGTDAIMAYLRDRIPK